MRQYSTTLVDECQYSGTIELSQAVPGAALRHALVTHRGCFVAAAAGIVETPEFKQACQR